MDKISQEKLDAVYDSVIADVTKALYEPEAYQKRVDEFSDETGKLDLTSFGNLILSDSRLYSNKVLHEVLSRLLVDDDPK